MVAQIPGFILGLLTVFVVTAFILYHYANIRKQHALVTIATLIAWYFSFIIVFILPVDVSSTSYRQCVSDCNSSQSEHPLVDNVTTASIDVKESCTCVEPWTNLPEELLLVFWKIVYWTSQVLTWLVLPLMQSYSTAGAFTVLGKLRSAIISNLIFYGTYLAIFCVCLIYVATRPDIRIDAENLKVIGITASNTWGLFLLVLLYGYGLVDVPRSIWQSSYTHLLLQQTYFKIAKISMESSEAQEKYEDTLEDVRKAAEAIKYNHPYRQYIDIIVSKCPEEFSRRLKRHDDYVEYNENDSRIPTEKQLIKMHISVITVVRNYRRTQAQKASLLKQALQLEDDVANLQSTNRYYKSSVKYDGYFKLVYSPRLVWWWRCVLRSATLKVLAVLFALFSAMVVWSECVFFITSPTLSLFALFIKSCRVHFSYFSIEIVSIIVISYLCVCAYRTVFKIRVFNYYYLVTNHQSDEYSLLFSAMLLSRLTPPLCLNFLSLIHLDSHITRADNVQETAYTNIMGHMDVISFIANGFNIYFPIGIVLLCLFTCLRLGSRLLHCIGFEQFIDDDMTQETIDEGRNHVQREKIQRERDRSRQQRADDWRRTLDNSTTTTLGTKTRFFDRSTAASTSYQSISDDMTPLHQTTHSTSLGRLSGGGSSRSSKKEDRVEILSDQDVVEYNPDSNSSDNSFYQQQSGNTRVKKSNIFDDV